MTQNNNGYLTVARDDVLFAVMFRYVDSLEAARTIANEKKLKPNSNHYEMVSMYNGDYDKARINLTDVRPEEGRMVIEGATFLNPKNIQYGLELLVEPDKIEQKFHGFPRAYQIFTEDSVDVTILKIWNMDRVERRIGQGYQIHREVRPRGGISSYYIAPQP